MKILIKNGHVIDPLTGRDGCFDVLVEKGRIQKVAERLEDTAERVIDAAGCYVMPGFIDLHVHLRDPGLEYKETLKTGGEAAARGGVTTICAMPNTKPVVDDGEKVAEVHKRAKAECPVNVIQIGAVTRGQEGVELSDIEGMARAGCHAVSEDGEVCYECIALPEGYAYSEREGDLGVCPLRGQKSDDVRCGECWKTGGKTAFAGYFKCGGRYGYCKRFGTC